MISTITTDVLTYLAIAGVGGAVGYGVWWLLPGRSKNATGRNVRMRARRLPQRSSAG